MGKRRFIRGRSVFSSAFLATKYGFEYRSETFDAAMKIKNIDSDDQLDHFDDKYSDYDELTDAVKISDSIKVTLLTPAPSSFAVYCGFAPWYQK